MNTLILRVAAMVILGAAEGAPQANGPAARAAGRYTELFGKEDEAVRASPGTLDDFMFSAKLFDAARKLSNTRDLQVLVYQKAYEFAARRSSGYKRALKVVDILQKLLPHRRAEWQEKRLKVLTLRYLNSYSSTRKEMAQPYLDAMMEVANTRLAEGNSAGAYELYRRAYGVAVKVKSPLLAEIRDKAARLSARVATDRKLETMKKLLAAKPTVRNRENLIYLYLTELDKPDAAKELIKDGVDKKLQTFVPLAAAPPAELKPQKCFDLAQWYESLLKRPASTKAKVNVLQRAKRYYLHYISQSGKQAVNELKAKVAIVKINKTLDRMDPNRLTLDCGDMVPIRLVRLPTGSFLMGSPSSERSRGSDEGPQHTVKISKRIYMGVTEVTQRQYSAIMGVNPSAAKNPANPVENVSLSNAVAFCKKLAAKSSRKVRLPIETEWEYACRAGSKTAFCFGDDARGLTGYAWSGLDSGKKVHPVGGKKPNAWGLYDMHGNVREFVMSPYSTSSYRTAASIAPQDPSVCRGAFHRRGGSAFRDTSLCRSANRLASSGTADSSTGFRIIVEAR